jgi:hypothetical protein
MPVTCVALSNEEERDSLKAQLQHERAGNILLVKSQYEDTLKHQ